MTHSLLLEQLQHFHGLFLQQLLKYLPGETFLNLPADEGGGERSHYFYLACKHYFQGSGALTCQSNMSILPLKGDCCSLVQRNSSLLKTSGICSLGSLKAIEQRGFLIHHNYTNTCAEQPCTELPTFFFSCSPILNTPHLQFGGLMAEHRMQWSTDGNSRSGKVPRYTCSYYWFWYSFTTPCNIKLQNFNVRAKPELGIMSFTGVLSILCKKIIIRLFFDSIYKCHPLQYCVQCLFKDFVYFSRLFNCFLESYKF